MKPPHRVPPVPKSEFSSENVESTKAQVSVKVPPPPRAREIAPPKTRRISYEQQLEDYRYSKTLIVVDMENGLLPPTGFLGEKTTLCFDKCISDMDRERLKPFEDAALQFLASARQLGKVFIFIPHNSQLAPESIRPIFPKLMRQISEWNMEVVSPSEANRRNLPGSSHLWETESLRQLVLGCLAVIGPPPLKPRHGSDRDVDESLHLLRIGQQRPLCGLSVLKNEFKSIFAKSLIVPSASDDWNRELESTMRVLRQVYGEARHLEEEIGMLFDPSLPEAQ